MSGNKFGDLFSVIIAASKDKAYLEISEKLQKSLHEYIISEAANRRDKTDTLIRAMAKIDIELIQFEREYKRIDNDLSENAKKSINELINEVEQRKKDIIFEKNSFKKR